ncbi:MAG: DeoR/GlpR transcriptional regulator [Firmicutes bacterium]|nr:DeoR/GlpR transcriptional regulator [Bacillota bacterium]
MGGSGLCIQRGLTDPGYNAASVKRAMIDVSRKTMVVMDHAKLGQLHVATVCGLDMIDTVVTDAKAPAEYVEQLQDQGVRVIVAPYE